MTQIPLFKVLNAPEAAQAVAEVLASGHVAQGPKVDQFERALEKALGCYPGQEILTVNSGTSALHLAMVLAGVGPGTEVIATPMTCAATIMPIVHLGAKIVWADVDPVTGLIDFKDVGRKLSSNTKAVVAVDWAGTPCDYEMLHWVIRNVPSSNGRAMVIEDAAHAFEALYPTPDGLLSLPHAMADKPHIICWSFQAIKHLNTGDGGALLAMAHTQEHQHWLTERARKLRWFGLDRTSSKDFRCEQLISEAGFKFHMSDITAAIGLANLDSAVTAVGMHKSNARLLHGHLEDLRVRLGGKVTYAPYHAGSSYWVFTILVEDRASFQKFMAEQGIITSQVHRRNDEHPAFAARAELGPPLPGLDHFASKQCSIPCGWWMSREDLERVAHAVYQWTKL